MTTLGFDNIMFASAVYPIKVLNNSSSIVRSLITRACLKFGWKARMFVYYPSSTAIASAPELPLSMPLSLRVTERTRITVFYVATGNLCTLTLISNRRPCQSLYQTMLKISSSAYTFTTCARTSKSFFGYYTCFDSSMQLTTAFCPISAGGGIGICTGTLTSWSKMRFFSK